ncbi:P-loop containing nucleoside triphosphate hydrolase protein [Hyaloraphidium curvatum]|nr:P-loop containing nucleoside triphosphate hydrolase protein [Hyaloraphidium curvatum]
MTGTDSNGTDVPAPSTSAHVCGARRADPPGRDSGRPKRGRSKKDPPGPPPWAGADTSPEDQAGVLSRASLWWLTPLVRLGYKRPLIHEDLYPLKKNLDAHTISDGFAAKWRDEKARAATAAPPKDKVKLFNALWAAYGFQFLIAGFFLLVVNICTLTSPVVLRFLLEDINGGGAVPGRDKAFGYAMAATLFALQLFSTLANNGFQARSSTTGFMVRTSLVSAIYDKTLRLSPGARVEFTAGKTVNLMSVDTSRLDAASSQLHQLWSAPLVVSVAIVILLVQLGPPALAGLALLIVMVPVQAFVMRYLVRLRRETNKLTDKRVRMTQEAMAGIRVLKFLGWEAAMENQLAEVRMEELKNVRTIGNIRAYIMGVSQAQPILASLLTFVAYGLAGRALTPPLAFSSIALFNVLRMPLNQLPRSINAATDAYVSLQRVEAFLFAPEIEPIPSGGGAPGTIDIRGAEYVWEEPVQVLPDHLRERRLRPNKNKGGGGNRDTARSANLGSTFTSNFGSTFTLNRTFRTSRRPPTAPPAPPHVPDVTPAEPFTGLHDITLSVQPGWLVAVVGRVGSGKSSLLAALTGEIRRTGGEARMDGGIGYCPQTAWIQNATLKDNVLFGLPFDEATYKRALAVAALEKDLEILPHGDMTEIGERGITLSGGQRARVSLARTVYSDPDIVLLDDPLSAVDANVGRHIFEQCIAGALAGKTRILATHQIHVLPACDWIVCLQGGRIAEQGRYAELLGQGGYLAKLMAEFGGADKVEEVPVGGKAEDKAETESTADAEEERAREEEEEVEAVANPDGELTPGDTDCDDAASEVDEGDGKQNGDIELGKPSSLRGSAKPGKTDLGTTVLPSAAGKLMMAEERYTGHVRARNYWAWARFAGGWRFVASVGTLLVGMQAFKIGTDAWLAQWSVDAYPWLGLGQYMGIYVALGMTQAACILGMGLALSYQGRTAAKKMHEVALHKVMHAPTYFFDRTPVGRIMNRFSRDVEMADNSLPEAWRMVLTTFANAISTLVLISIVQPIFIAVMVPLLVAYFFAQDFYRATAREVKRLESISRSPLFANFGETLAGLSTIRAFRAEPRFSARNGRHLDHNNAAYYLAIMQPRWLSLRLEFISACLVFTAAAIAVGTSAPGAAAGLLSLAVTYSLQLTQTMNGVVRQSAETEIQMNGVERLLHYAGELEQEPTDPPTAAPQAWPAGGGIEIRDLVVKYRPELPPVLLGISVRIRPGERVGVVGRTGAGKSTIMTSLFRLVEPTSGSILVDGVDISGVGLHDLRSRLAMIPQESTLFSGSVRYNLDPFGEHTDAEIWSCLARAGGMAEAVAALPDKLESRVAENGDNFSVGQRSLLCLARAMLRGARVVVMDEATASVDLATDELIQRTIRVDEAFRGRTVLTIAHRLFTVMDYDRILVLDRGRIAQFGPPAELLAVPGPLRSLVEETGRENAEVLFRMAEKAAARQA